MKPRMPVWLMITLAVLVVVGVIIGLIFVVRWNPLVGWIITGILLAAIAAVVAFAGPPLFRWYRFQKYFKQYESQLHQLPSLLQTGRTQEALLRFDGVMKYAPDNAYLFYMKALFLQAAGKLPEAKVATGKALSMIGRDPMLQITLQQMGGQMGQPTTVDEFRERVEELSQSLEPRVNAMRQRHEKAVAKRKKKSR